MLHNESTALFHLASLVAVVPVKVVSSMCPTRHSSRHLLPRVAEVPMWHALMWDELARWATGAANSKQVKCGPHYTVQANQSPQVFIQRSLRSMMAAILPLVAVGEGHKAAVRTSTSCQLFQQ